jgi:hypothetical protein
MLPLSYLVRKRLCFRFVLLGCPQGLIWQVLFEIVASVPREILPANSHPQESHRGHNSDRRPILGGSPTSKFAL